MSSNSSVPMEPAPPSKDRIEELERAIWQMHSEAHEHIKRVGALEAALQEIGKTNSYAGILARRALEGKP